MSLTYIPSGRKRDLACLEGYTYDYNNKGKTAAYYTCTRRAHKCSARLIVRENGSYEQRGDHSGHLPNQEK